MPREARYISKTGIYHIMVRGINQQQVFEDEEDYRKYLSILIDCKAICGFKLYAYCLMGNHLHLLIETDKSPLEEIFKRIGSRFVYWYNLKYKRSGHLFQGRFKSEAVEENGYFKTVLRYIHQNPIKAGLVEESEDYPWSSYNEYINGKSDFVDIEYAKTLFYSEDEFIFFMNKSNSDSCLDINENKVFGMTDEQAQRLIKKISGCTSVSEFQQLEEKKRQKNIKKFKEKGMSIRQISRLTGVTVGIVRKE